MLRLTLSLFVVFSLTATAKQIWIIGEEYVGFSDLHNPLQHTPLEPTSWGLDSNHCQVWITDKARNLFLLTPRLRTIYRVESTDRILSNVEEGFFYTRSENPKQFEKRDIAGKTVTSFPRDWASSVHSLLFDAGLTLHFMTESNKIWLGHIDQNLELKGTTEIPTGKTVWQNPKFLFDPSSKDVWTGFSTTTAKHIYSPVVELRKTTGERTQLFEWPDRGLFFGFCLDDNRSIIAARDIPSDNGFTVPVYSYLEKISAAGNRETLYGAEVNWLIDALVCDSNQVIMAQRSMWSSEGNFLLSWDRTSNKEATKLFKLPGRALEIFSCED